MDRERVVDLLGLGACAVWLGLSLVSFWHGDGSVFARLGALGTSVAVGYFALIRHSVPYPVGLHEKLHLVNSRLNYGADCQRISFQNTTLLATGLKDLAQQTKNTVPGFVEVLADNKLLQHAIKTGAFPLDEWEAKGAQLVEQSKVADEQVSQVAFRAGKLQALIVVVATLQWGFGDLLFSSAR